MVEFYDTPTVVDTQVRTPGATLSDKVDTSEYYAERHIFPVLLIHIAFPDTELFANTSVFSLTYDGNEYVGAGQVAGVNAIEEGCELQVYGVEMVLMGVSLASITQAMTVNFREKDVYIYMALFDENLEIDDTRVTMVFKGKVNTMKVEQDVNNSCRILLLAENAMVDWERPNGEKYSHESQIKKYPRGVAGGTLVEQDNGFKYLASMIEKNIIWKTNA